MCPRPNDESRRLLDGVDLPCLPDGHARLDDEHSREQRDAVVGPGPQVLGKLHAGRAERAERQKRASQKNRRRARRTRSAKAT